jgi:hypothetical protein
MYIILKLTGRFECYYRSLGAQRKRPQMDVTDHRINRSIFSHGIQAQAGH